MATVIKSFAPHQRASTNETRAVAFRFDDIAQNANQYLDSMREEAARILRDANQDAAKIREEAAAQGRQAAIEAAHADLDSKIAKQMETALPALRKAVQAIDDAKHDWLCRWERLAVTLASRIASRIIRRELQSSPEIATELIREALSLASGARQIRLFVNPADLRTLESQGAEISDCLGRLAPGDIRADASIVVGGCRVTTEFGEIDLTVESQLDRIIEELTG